MLAFDLDEVGYLAKGRGVTLMGLDKGEKLVAVAVTRERSVAVTGFGRGRENEVEIAGKDFAHYVSKRGLKGRVLPDKVKKPLGLRVLSSVA
jgi:hypothetical protein